MNWLKKRKEARVKLGEDEESIQSEDEDTDSELGDDKKPAKPEPPMKDLPDITKLAKDALQIRKDLAASWPEEMYTPDFGETAVGTKDTHERLGVGCDCMKGKPVTKLGKNLLSKHFKRQQVSYGITKKFSNDDAVMMVRMWCHRLQHFADAWSEQKEADSFVFSDECVQSYTPLERFTEWRSRIDPTSKSHAARLQQLDELKPKYLMTEDEFRRA